jgi:hypothetical protein
LLKVDLRLSHASVHRELGVLVGLELVRRVVPRRNGRGRPFAIYAVKGYTADDVVRVVERVSRMRTPAYSRVRVISQLILDEYLEPRGLREITMREIMDKTQAKCRGFYSGDIARLVVKELVAEGIKVWR